MSDVEKLLDGRVAIAEHYEDKDEYQQILKH